MERARADAPPQNCPQPATKKRKTVFKFYLLKGQRLYDFVIGNWAGGWPEVLSPHLQLAADINMISGPAKQVKFVAYPGA